MKKTDTKNKKNKRVNRSNVSVSAKNRTTANRNYTNTGYSRNYESGTYGRYDSNFGMYSGARSTAQSNTYSYNRSVSTARRNAVHERESYMQQMQMSSPMYNTGSEAYENAYSSEWIPNDNTSNKKTLKKKSNVRRVREVAPLNLYKTIFTVLVCTFYVLSIVVCIASNNNYKSQLVDAKNTLTQLESDNAELKNEIEDNIDLAKVEKEARKLGMQKPSTFQTVKINVPKESYTVQYGADEVDEDGIGFTEVMEDLTEKIQKRLDKILRID